MKMCDRPLDLILHALEVLRDVGVEELGHARDLAREDRLLVVDRRSARSARASTSMSGSSRICLPRGVRARRSRWSRSTSAQPLSAGWTSDAGTCRRAISATRPRRREHRGSRESLWPHGSVIRTDPESACTVYCSRRMSTGSGR